MPDRIILINKPYHWTSFDVVKKLRKPLLEERKRELSPEDRLVIKKLKVGHAGTLDPLATGLLVRIIRSGTGGKYQVLGNFCGECKIQIKMFKSSLDYIPMHTVQV